MEKNRKVLFSILVFLMLSVVFALVDINQKIENDPWAARSSNGILSKIVDGVGIVNISGPITMTGAGSSFSSVQGSLEIINSLNMLVQDKRIKAIVVRINSPGGTVAATQEIYNKIIKIRKKMPCIASMGDIAASGGYYIASACTEIYANEGTITGSIGVIIRSPNMRELFKKIGIKMNVIKSGKYKDILSSSREITSQEKQMIQEMIDSTYQQFVKDVAFGRGRNTSLARIKKYADGRVMNGEKAKYLKLVDETGTFEDAIQRAKELAKLSASAPVYHKKRSIFEEIVPMIQSTLGFNGVNKVISEVNNYSFIEYRYVP